MAASTNKRIYYAVHQVGFQPDGGGDWQTAKGIQSVGMTTNFNLDQVFQLGQLAIYENIEEIPDIEVTLNKVLDGRAPVYLSATQGALEPTLAGRSNEKITFALSIFPDSATASEGNPDSMVQCSGMFVSSVAYNFPLDDNFNEDVTLVGNSKIWYNDPEIEPTNPAVDEIPDSGIFQGGFSQSSNDAPTGSGGVNRREAMLFTVDTGGHPSGDANGYHTDPDATCLPTAVFGINPYGANLKSNGEDFDAHISNITVSTDLGREEINELGRKGPYLRSVTFPVEVTCEVEVTSTSGDMVSATEFGIRTPGTGDACSPGGNLEDSTIRIATCEGTRISLGAKNKLASVNYSGGDAGGGNVAVSYTFTTFNDFTVIHPQDPAGSTFFTNRESWLVTLPYTTLNS